MNVNQISGSNVYVDSTKLRADQHVSPPETDAAAGAAELQDYHAPREDVIMDRTLEQVNVALSKADRVVVREIHETTKAMMYKFKDTKTGEVIAEYPPEKFQDMIAGMWEYAGMFVDHKA